MPLPRALLSLHCFWRHRRKKLTAISRKYPHSCLHLNSSQCCHLNQPLIISNINCCDISNSYLGLHHLYVLKCISYSHPSASPLARVLFCPDLSKRLCKPPSPVLLLSTPFPHSMSHRLKLASDKAQTYLKSGVL